MSNSTVKISQLPVALTVEPDDVVPIDQDGTTKRATAAQFQAAGVATQSFLTVNPEPGLATSRQLVATGGLALTDNGPGSTLALATIGLLSSLSALGASGLIVNVGGTAVVRGLVAPVEGFIIVDPAGIAGNPTFVLTDDLAALEALGGTGIAVRAGVNTWVQRLVAGTPNEITVTNGNGVAGDPTIALPAALTFTGKTITGGTFTAPTLTTPVVTVLDSQFTVQDNVDPTKQFQFQASSIPTATTRTYIVPSVNDTLAGILDTIAAAAILG